MKKPHFNLEQKKHLAALIDKLALAYFAAVGVSAWLKDDLLMALHAVVFFVIMEIGAVWVLGDKDGTKS